VIRPGSPALPDQIDDARSGAVFLSGCQLVHASARTLCVAPAHELDHVRVDNAVPQRRPGARVRNAGGQLGRSSPSKAHSRASTGPISRATRWRKRAASAGLFPEVETATVMSPSDGSRRDEAAMVQVVNGVEQHALPLGLGQTRALAARSSVPAMASQAPARSPDDRAGGAGRSPRCRELRQARRGLGTHHGDVRAGREQAEHFLLGDCAAADHYSAAPTQVEKHGIERHGLTGTEARSASMPTRWQKSPNRSSSTRSSR